MLSQPNQNAAPAVQSDPSIAPGAPWSVSKRQSALLIVAFFICTFALTWSCWIPVVRGAAYLTPFSNALWLLGTFAPSLVALAITAAVEGRAGVVTLLSRLFQWRVPGRWYLFAVGYIAAVKLVVAALHRVMIGAWPRFGHEGPALMLVAILFSTPVQSGEEIGWRGFALPRLAQRIGYGPASVLVGVVWACWHIPQFYVSAADTYQQSFPLWSLQVIALSIAMAWLFVRVRGSLLLMMLMHAAVNNTKDIVPSAAANPTDAFSLHASPVMYLTVAVMWAAAAYFLLRMRGQKDTKTENPN